MLSAELEKMSSAKWRESSTTDESENDSDKGPSAIKKSVKQEEAYDTNRYTL